jgi:hypothetical protein
MNSYRELFSCSSLASPFSAIPFKYIWHIGPLSASASSSASAFALLSIGKSAQLVNSRVSTSRSQRDYEISLGRQLWRIALASGTLSWFIGRRRERHNRILDSTPGRQNKLRKSNSARAVKKVLIKKIPNLWRRAAGTTMKVLFCYGEHFNPRERRAETKRNGTEDESAKVY